MTKENCLSKHPFNLEWKKKIKYDMTHFDCSEESAVEAAVVKNVDTDVLPSYPVDPVVDTAFAREVLESTGLETVL